MKLSQWVNFLWIGLPHPSYRMDKNTNGGGIALYVREDIRSRQISFKNDDRDIERFLLLKSTSARKSG